MGRLAIQSYYTARGSASPPLKTVSFPAAAADPLQCAPSSCEAILLSQTTPSASRASHHRRSRHHRRRTLRTVPGIRARAAGHQRPHRRFARAPGRAVRGAVPGQADLRHPGAAGMRRAGARRPADAADQALQAAVSPGPGGDASSRAPQSGRFHAAHQRRHHASMPARSSSPPAWAPFSRGASASRASRPSRAAPSITASRRRGSSPASSLVIFGGGDSALDWTLELAARRAADARAPAPRFPRRARLGGEDARARGRGAHARLRGPAALAHPRGRRAARRQRQGTPTGACRRCPPTSCWCSSGCIRSSGRSPTGGSRWRRRRCGWTRRSSRPACRGYSPSATSTSTPARRS